MKSTKAPLARTATRSRLPVSLWLAGLVSAAVVLVGAMAAQAQETTVAHGISTFGPLKYPADFAHLDYVNPDAPKGGEIVIANQSGTFDSFNPYARKGVPRPWRRCPSNG